MKNRTGITRPTVGMHMSRLTIVTILFLTICCSLAMPVAAQSGDALKKVDEILRYMKSPNYAEDELVRRVVWNDKLVNEIISYRNLSDDDRQNFLRFLDISIARYQDENLRLKILIRAITTLDPLVQKYFPQWIVQDEPMILELMRKIRDNRDDMSDADAVVVVDRVLSGKAKIRIVQSPRDHENVLGILIEKARPKSENNDPSSGFIENLDDGSFEDYRIVGKKNIEGILQTALYTRLIERERYAHVMETGVIKPTPYVASANVGIPFGGGFMWTLQSDELRQEGVGEIQISRIRAGFELKIGNDWVNLPFLYGPQWNLLFVYEPSPYEYLKIGPSIPFSWGDKSIQDDFPLFKHRLLNGTLGVSAEYNRQLTNVAGTFGEDASGIGAAAFVSTGLRTLGSRKVIDLNGTIINGTGASKDNNVRVHPFYHIAYTATGYYWRDLGFLLTGLRASLGLGYQKVVAMQRQSKPTIAEQAYSDSVEVITGPGEGKAVLDPYLRLQYDNRGKTQYGLALQYFNGGLMGEAYFHIFSWLRAEVKYARVVFRDAEVWEHSEIIVPGLRIGFDF